jgi:hypothetical protein
VSGEAPECPSCGVVMAKYAEAADRAYLRRQTLARQKAVVVVEEKRSPWRMIFVVALIALCVFGAWQWYTDDTTSDLDRLAAEIKQSDGSRAPIDNGRANRMMLRYVVRFGIACAAFAIGYQNLKSRLSP